MSIGPMAGAVDRTMYAVPDSPTKGVVEPDCPTPLLVCAKCTQPTRHFFKKRVSQLTCFTNLNNQGYHFLYECRACGATRIYGSSW